MTITCSPTSGFHHARYSEAGGFCTFNGLIIAARKLIEQDRLANRVGILDLDMHWGDGTEQIIGQIIEQLNLGSIDHYSFGKQGLKMQDIPSFLDHLAGRICDTFKQCDLVIYQAGADPHIDDPLGGLMTTEQMRVRDKIVFNPTSTGNTRRMESRRRLPKRLLKNT